MIDGVMGRKYIVTDLRKYIKKVDDKPIVLKDIISNHSYAMFQINRAILLDIYLEDDGYKFLNWVIPKPSIGWHCCIPFYFSHDVVGSVYICIE